MNYFSQLCTTLAFPVALSGLVVGQGAFSMPSGYVSEPLKANSLNIIGNGLQESVVDTGFVEKAESNQLTLSEHPKHPRKPLPGNTTYIFEVTSGALGGVIQEITSDSIQGNVLTTPQDLTELGLQVSDSFKIRPAQLLSEFCRKASDAISRGKDKTDPLADVIWVPDGQNSYGKYFIRSSDSAVCSMSTGEPVTDVPLINPDGLIIQKRGSAASILTLTGAVCTSDVSVVIRPGINMVGTSFPAGATLQNLGFEESLSSASSEERSKADSIWVANPQGNFDTFYFNSDTSAWHNSANNNPAPENLFLPSGIIVERRSPKPVNLKLNAPHRSSGGQ